MDSTSAVLVWGPGASHPSYAVPGADISTELHRARDSDAGHRHVHPGIPFTVHTARRANPYRSSDRSPGFRLDDPDLAGYVVLDFDAFDGWLEEDERDHGHPRDPYSRIDVRRTSRPVRIELDGEVLADTTTRGCSSRPGIHTRFYLPKEDVRGELRAQRPALLLPVQGRGVVLVGRRPAPDIAWSYEDPLPDGAR